MHFSSKVAALTIGCFLLALLFAAPYVVKGDEWNLATRFTVSHPFEVPGMVLQPNTRYVIRLHDSPSTRNVVQIFNEDETRMLTMFMGISDERLEPADHTVFTFIETQPGFPLPVKEWFYPGRLNGLEFVYPKEQALEIARHAREPVLSGSGNLHDLAALTVEAIQPLGTQAPATTATASNITKSETTTIAESKPTEAESTPYVEKKQEVEEPEAIAENTEPEVQREKPAETPAATEETKTAENTENRELPQTAGELPLIALIGALCLGAGLGMKVLSSKS